MRTVNKLIKGEIDSISPLIVNSLPLLACTALALNGTVHNKIEKHGFRLLLLNCSKGFTFLLPLPTCKEKAKPLVSPLKIPT